MTHRLLVRAIVLAAATPSALVACGSGGSAVVAVTGPGGASGAGGSSAGAGAGGAGATDAFGGGSSETPLGTYPCANPSPIVVEGKDTGVERCAGGSLHKKVSIECPVGTPSLQPPCGGGGSGCTLATECTDQPNGYCLEDPGMMGSKQCGCFYGCTTDAECAAGHVCLCGDPIGRCVPSSCTSDADCTPGNLCGSYDPSKGCDQIALACHTDGDACGSSQDCGDVPPSSGAHDYCVPGSGGSGAWSCEHSACMVGRPLFVEARLIVAELATSVAWA